MQSQQQPAPAGAHRRTGFASPDELDELLALARTTITGRAAQSSHQLGSSAAPAQTQAVPVVELPTERNALFDVYRKLQKDIAALAVQARDIESHLFGDHWDSVIKTPETKDVSDIAYTAMENLFLQAERRYAPVGGTLQINRGEVWRELGMEERNHWRNVDRGAAIPFDLDKLQAHLEAKYGGDAGETAAYQQQAKVLIDFFGFNQADKLVEKPRHVECTVRMWSSHKDYAPKGTLEISYNSQEYIRKAFQALGCAMAWAGKHELQGVVARSPLQGYGFAFSSRHRESYPGLDIILFKEKWIWQFSHEVAEQLRLFLGQYSA